MPRVPYPVTNRGKWDFWRNWVPGTEIPDDRPEWEKIEGANPKAKEVRNLFKITYDDDGWTIILFGKQLL